MLIDEPDTTPTEPEESSSKPAMPSPSAEERVSADEIRSASSALGVAVPRSWQQILLEVGARYLGGVYIDRPSRWEEYQPDHEDLKAGDDTLPSRMLAVASTACGDWYSLDLDHVSSDGDCPVLMFDHEIDRCIDCWPSVAEFIDQALERHTDD